jgi:hypothetical protein
MQAIDLKGRRVATWDHGEGKPLLFVHGVGTSVSSGPPTSRSCPRTAA